MDIANARIGTFISIDIFNQFFTELYKSGDFPREQVTGDPESPIATTLLDLPTFKLVEREGELFTALHLTGTIEMHLLNKPPEPLDVLINLAIEATPREGEAPVVMLAYRGILESANDIVITNALSQTFKGDEISQLLEDSAIELLGPMISALSGARFPEGGAPGPDEWPVATQLYQEASGTQACVGVFVADVGEALTLPREASPLPHQREIGVTLAKGFLDPIFEEQAKAQIGTSQDDAVIKKLKLHMGDDALMVDGEAEKDGAKIEFKGPVELQLIMGTSTLVASARDLDVDVTKPWYYYLGLAVAPILFFIPILGMMFIGFLVSKSLEAASAPDKLRRSLGSALTDALGALGGGLSSPGNDGDVTLESTPTNALIVNGNLMLLAQAFVSPMTDSIGTATWSRSQRRFLGYILQGGRPFAASELARLVHAGKIIVPGHHDVKGRYLRANPNQREGDNLLERFGPH